MPAIAVTFDIEPALARQRAALVRLCRQLTGDHDSAEDQAQQTLLEAWRRLDRLYDPAGLERWLHAIARNVCRRWARERGERRAAEAQPSAAGEADAPAWEETLPGAFDVEVDLERADLAALLDRAMALLPPDTRQALLQRYVAGSPQAEIARRLGMSEGAVEARLQRGKLTLRRLLSTTFAADAAAYGLVTLGDDRWQPTRLWCPGCGQRRLEGLLHPDDGQLLLRCPACVVALDPYWRYMDANIGDALLGVRTFKPAVSRCLGLIHDLFQVQAAGGAARCPSCHDWLPIIRDTWPGSTAPWDRSERLRLYCPRCRTFDDRESRLSIAWSLPETRRFWREHPRMRFLPGREIEFQGSPAVVTGFASCTDAARIEIVSLRATGKTLRVLGTQRDDEGTVS